MIKPKKKLCDNCNTLQYIWKNDKGSKYCKYCWYSSKQESKPLKKKAINKKSKTMTALDSLYSRLRKKFLTDNPMCEARIHNCSLKSTDVHHKKGRGKYYLDVKTWLSVCRQCHNWIEEHPDEAKKLGFSKDRL